MTKVQGKWIQDIAEMCGRQGSGADAFFTIEEYLDKVDVLLHIASSETDNGFLHDDIHRLLMKGFPKDTKQTEDTNE